MTWTPPPFATLGFALFASLFDRVAVICQTTTCQGHLEAFPTSLQPHVVIINASRVSEQLGITNIDDHGYKVTQGHAAAWALLRQDGVQHVLVLEDDYRVANWSDVFVEQAAKSTALRQIEDFVDSAEWSLLRVGYSPVSHATQCRAECACVPTNESANVCAVTLGQNVSAPFCDVRSFVGYAVHKNMYAALESFARASLDNLTDHLGLVSNAVAGSHSHKEEYFATPQDLFFPATLSVMHYLTPGFLYQADKLAQLPAMVDFGLSCNEQATGTPLGQAATPPPPSVDGQLDGNGPTLPVRARKIRLLRADREGTLAPAPDISS